MRGPPSANALHPAEPFACFLNPGVGFPDIFPCANLIMHKHKNRNVAHSYNQTIIVDSLPLVSTNKLASNNKQVETRIGERQEQTILIEPCFHECSLCLCNVDC